MSKPEPNTDLIEIELTPTDTLRSWKHSLSKAAFIYEEILSLVNNKFNTITLAILILSSISTIISGISTLTLSVDDPTYKTIGLVINCFIFVISGAVTLLQAMIKLYNLNEKISDYSGYSEKIDNMYSMIANYLALPSNSKENPLDFIKRESDNYLQLIRQSPKIDAADHRFALKKYELFIKDDTINYRLAWKLRSSDQIIDVI